MRDNKSAIAQLRSRSSVPHGSQSPLIADPSASRPSSIDNEDANVYAEQYISIIPFFRPLEADSDQIHSKGL
jgi:hypothetical protein